jgi:hypothetical protein
MAAPLVIDWFRLLWDLIQRGYSIADVSKLADIPESTMKGYMRGSHPVHWRGEALVHVWCKTCGKPREALQMTELYTGPRVVERKPGPKTVEGVHELERVWR